MGQAYLTGRSVRMVSSNDAGVKIALLWENASPTSTFAAQTVELDLSGYEMCMIEYAYNADNAHLKLTQIAKIVTGNSIRLISLSGQSSAGVPQNRDGEFGEGGISFTVGRRTGSTDNTVCIPERIYGLKGVTWA